MPLWPIAPIAQQPSSTLTSWNVFETERQERHLCGYAIDAGEGRVTSAIVKFDPAKGAAVTSSGRVYRLKGCPGVNADAEYVKANWLRLNSVLEHQDVTKEVWASIQADRAGGQAAR